MYYLKPSVLTRKSGVRYSSVLARMCDIGAVPERSDMWRRGPEGCVVVFTPEDIMDALLKFQATGTLCREL